ncbi:MAG: RNA polymerase sigma factor [Flavobacteriales bacterium]
MSTIEFNDALVGIQSNLFSFALNFTKNREDARDLTQETLLKAINYRTYYTPNTNFKAWVFTIMRNIFINQYRRNTKTRMIFDHSEDLYLFTNHKSAEGSPMERLGVKEINQKIDGLNDELKTPFKMHFEGFKYKEIADAMKLPIGTIKSRIFIARKRLMDQLPDYQFSEN